MARGTRWPQRIEARCSRRLAVRRTFQGPEDYLRTRNASITVVDDARCIALMRAFIAAHPD